MAAAKAEEIEVGGHQIALSHPEKVLYPSDGYSKRDILDYYWSVAEVMVRYTRNKPLTLRRFPDGVGTEGFFQKEASNHFPAWTRVEPIPQRDAQRAVHHVVCDDPATILYLASQACLEFHVALSTIDDLERPNVLVVDLDPPDGIDIADLRSVVRNMIDRFRGAGLVPYLQATGGKGFHVIAPLTVSATFDQVRESTHDMVRSAARDDPQWLTTEHRKDKRGNRIFLDTNRNAYGQTMICPYSLRARTGAPAATPLDLTELSRVRPRDYGLANMARRLGKKKDPWHGLERDAVRLGDTRLIAHE